MEFYTSVNTVLILLMSPGRSLNIKAVIPGMGISMLQIRRSRDRRLLENREFVLIIIVQFMMSANIRIRFGLQIVLFFVQYTISLSSLCELIWRHWTYKMPVRYILSSVWVRLSISLRYPLYNMWGCMFSVHPLTLWWLREYICFVLLS